MLDRLSISRSQNMSIFAQKDSCLCTFVNFYVLFSIGKKNHSSCYNHCPVQSWSRGITINSYLSTDVKSKDVCSLYENNKEYSSNWIQESLEPPSCPFEGFYPVMGMWRSLTSELILKENNLGTAETANGSWVWVFI